MIASNAVMIHAAPDRAHERRSSSVHRAMREGREPPQCGVLATVVCFEGAADARYQRAVRFSTTSVSCARSLTCRVLRISDT